MSKETCQILALEERDKYSLYINYVLLVIYFRQTLWTRGYPCHTIQIKWDKNAFQEMGLEFRGVGWRIFTYSIVYSYFCVLLEIISFIHYSQKLLLLFPHLPQCFQLHSRKQSTQDFWGLFLKHLVGVFCTDAYSIRPSASSILPSLLSELPNEIKLCLVKACVLRSLFVLLFISICYTHCTFFPFEDTDGFLSRPAACSCIRVAWLQQHFTGFSLKAKCVCSFWGPSSGNG